MIYSLSTLLKGALFGKGIATMASAHLEALNARHASIDGMIAAEMTRPLPDSTRLAQLKKQKLRLKEEMRRSS
jgi:hypothetical protein